MAALLCRRLQEAWKLEPQLHTMSKQDLLLLCYYSHLSVDVSYLSDEECFADIKAETTARLSKTERRMQMLRANRRQNKTLDRKQEKEKKRLASSYATELQHGKWEKNALVDAEARAQLFILRLQPRGGAREKARSILKWLEHGNPHLEKAVSELMGVVRTKIATTEGGGTTTEELREIRRAATYLSRFKRILFNSDVEGGGVGAAKIETALRRKVSGIEAGGARLDKEGNSLHRLLRQHCKEAREWGATRFLALSRNAGALGSVLLHSGYLEERGGGDAPSNAAATCLILQTHPSLLRLQDPSLYGEPRASFITSLCNLFSLPSSAVEHRMRQVEAQAKYRSARGVAGLNPLGRLAVQTECCHYHFGDTSTEILGVEGRLSVILNPELPESLRIKYVERPEIEAADALLSFTFTSVNQATVRELLLHPNFQRCRLCYWIRRRSKDGLRILAVQRHVINRLHSLGPRGKEIAASFKKEWDKSANEWRSRVVGATERGRTKSGNQEELSGEGGDGRKRMKKGV